MPNLEQIAAQYSLNRFPQHPYARAKYEQGFKDGVNSVLENENVNALVIDALSRAVERYNTTHINQLKLSEDGEIIEARNPLCVENDYKSVP